MIGFHSSVDLPGGVRAEERLEGCQFPYFPAVERVRYASEVELTHLESFRLLGCCVGVVVVAGVAGVAGLVVMGMLSVSRNSFTFYIIVMWCWSYY